jgi:isopropylmalate/homocitrate/citramalate synthase
MEDRIVENLRDGKLVIWEEVARDGAQAKTLMTGVERIQVAKSTAKIFGDSAADHLIFAAGFPSIFGSEFEIIRMLVDHVDECQLAVNGRAIREEVDLCMRAIRGAKFPRVAIVVPGSEILSQTMLHQSLANGLAKEVDILKYALDQADGIPVDVQIADVFSSDPAMIAESVNKFLEAGVATIGLGDSLGKMYPNEIKTFIEKLKKNIPADTMLSTHFHNDLGLALTNNLEAIKQGALLISTSWLGLGERSGLLPTEILLFLMSFEKEKLVDRFGLSSSDLFNTDLNLKEIIETAGLVSKFTGVEPKISDPIVGTGVNSISTGTPFVNPAAFQPFDPEKILGVKPKTYATQLANHRIVRKVTTDLGFDLDADQVGAVLKYIKTETYNRGEAIIPGPELSTFISSMIQKTIYS